jgi:tetratricopeptide (TPR) repeat protein
MLSVLSGALALSVSSGGFNPEGVILLLAILPALYLGAIVHEMGHVLFGRLGGFRITSAGMGLARPLWVGRLGATRLYLALSQPMQGITFVAHPRLLASRLSLLLCFIGGPLLQGVFALVLLALVWVVPSGHAACLLAGAINGVIALANLVPLRVRVGAFVMRTDGMLMLDALRRGTLETAPRDKVHMIGGLRRLWTAVGDTLILRMFLANLTLDWLLLDSPEAARRAWEEAEALPPEPLPWVQGYSAIVQGRLAAASGTWDVAEEAFARADRLFAEERHAEGAFLSALGQAELQALRGDGAGAVARLAELADDPLAVCRPGLRAALRMERLALQAALPGADLPALEDEARAISRGQPSAVHERRFYLALARAAVARGDSDRALGAFRAALAATGQVYDGWTDEPSREPFVAAQAPLLADARAFFEQQGLSEEVEKLKELFPLPKEVLRRRKEEAEQRTRRLHRLVCWLAPASIVPALVVGLLTMPPPFPGSRFFVAAVEVGVLASLALLLSLAMQLVGCFVAEMRRCLGWLPWMFLTGGWIGGLVALVLAG